MTGLSRDALSSSAPSSSVLSRSALAAVFVGGGVMHFVRPALYDAMIPPLLPWPRFWTLFTGVCEIAGGVGLLIPRLRRPAAFGLIAMLVGFLWVHVRMLIEPPMFNGHPVPSWLLWVRLPLQAVLIWWVWRVGRVGVARDS